MFVARAVWGAGLGERVKPVLVAGNGDDINACNAVSACVASIAGRDCVVRDAAAERGGRWGLGARETPHRLRSKTPEARIESEAGSASRRGEGEERRPHQGGDGLSGCFWGGGVRGRRAGLRRRPYEEERGGWGGGTQVCVSSEGSRAEDGRV